MAALAQDSGGVGMESRVGVRVHLRVAGDLVPTLAVTGLETRYEGSWNPFTPGTLYVDYRVENTGNVRLGSESTAVGSHVLGIGERSAPRHRAP
ncbi:hypothetical protein [Nesterenkonia flava]|uniref:Uncharacterized protein n=1 Tax=Nesterenkonia flava TaxID=469799 RepID=A0ABU1FWZ6_9MICC|nr:hypothetical protein [Nesterenkonia flava]MDR5712995.1 hypothetical protein [Nesterenkonia flava]